MAVLSYLLMFGIHEGLDLCLGDVKPPQDDSGVMYKCLRMKWSLSHPKCTLLIECVIYLAFKAINQIAVFRGPQALCIFWAEASLIHL